MVLRVIMGVASMACCTEAPNPPAPANLVLPWGPADCFVTKTFQDSEVFFKKDITYGSAYNPFGKKENEILKLDVAFPSAKDTRSMRPVLVWIHGGAYLGGDKDVENGENKQMIMTMATRGYVVVSINYRLVPLPSVKALNTTKPPQIATEDARAAVRFVRKMASEWRLDTSRIVVGGDSAGAITAMAYGFAKQFSDGHSGNAEYDSSINSVIAVSGSMQDLAFCKSIGDAPGYEPEGCTFNGLQPGDLTDQMSVGDVPVVMLHGTADTIVPYSGAIKVDAQAQKVGVRLELLTIPGAQHVPYPDVFNEDEPYFLKWLTHVSGSLNLADAECPSVSNVVV